LEGIAPSMPRPAEWRFFVCFCTWVTHSPQHMGDTSFAAHG
jgi:hypothetical protein